MRIWLKELRENLSEPPPKAPTEPTEAPYVGFVGGPQEDMQIIHQTFEGLQQVMEQAADWRNLDAILEDVQIAYESGVISQEEAEALGHIAIQESRTLPELAEEVLVL
mgnify:CR=1 FL=1|jgi:hypothetical protein